jgi:glutaconate CoA-transferase subunit B
VRLVGSGGAHDIALLARDVIIMMPHDPRRFVEKVDYITSPGLRSAANGMADIGARGNGPKCLITPRARFSFDAGELTLDAVADGMTEDQAVEGFGWSVPRAPEIRKLPPIEPPLARTASDLLAAWGRDAN